ncbi:MAG: hypothetical protein ACO1RA_05510 [Planctomycetaceae bacterium]
MNDYVVEITAEYGKPGEANYRKVIVDLQAGTITFFRCHQPSRFLAPGPDPEYGCSLDEIRGTCATWVRPRPVGAVLEVVTPDGRVRLPHAMSGFVAVRQVIEQAVARSGHRLAWYEYAAAREALVYVCGAAGAAVAIWALVATPGWVGALVVAAIASVPLGVCALFWWRGRAMW